MTPTPLELLAPARDAAVAIEAIEHGADAVYIGGPSHGARAAVGNSPADIERVVRHAHGFDAKVYVTLNTLIYPDEVKRVQALVRDYWRMGVDALIVQDLGLLEMDLPPIALHASTQCDIRTPEKAAMLAAAGMSQLVLPREFSLEEIRAVRQAVPEVVLEAFVHGALCVSYSGDCQASLMTTGRSANRGECSQVCRWKFDLTDGSGRTVAAGRYLLSLRDMNRIGRLAEMADAGISSFKIEGRLKDAAYVKNVVSAYRKALDSLIEGSEGRYTKASAGRCETNFEPDTDCTFNRGYTEYFLDGRPDDTERMGSHTTPKWVGVPVGRVTTVSRNRMEIRGGAELHNGDGLTYFDADGRLAGFRVNRVDGPWVYPAEMPAITAGTEVYRNADKAFDDAMARQTATRRIPIKFDLRRTPDGRVALDVCTAEGDEACRHRATAATDAPCTDKARTDQTDARRKVLDRLGGTRWMATDIADSLGDTFVPASVLTDLRRRAIDALELAMNAGRKPDLRRPSTLAADALAGLTTDYHSNVANAEARRFYESHGAKVAGEALETSSAPSGPLRVMTTRYCLRRELGACLRTPEGKRMAEPLQLSSQGNVFRLDFDCRECRMHVNLISTPYKNKQS